MKKRCLSICKDTNFKRITTTLSKAIATFGCLSISFAKIPPVPAVLYPIGLPVPWCPQWVLSVPEKTRKEIKIGLMTGLN